MRKNKNLVMLFFIALAAMLLPFLYTPYPLSDDAWQHIQKAECYLANGGFPFRAFYSIEVEDCISYPNYPPLFDIMLGFGKYVGMTFFARLLPSLLAALTVFAFYPLARKFLDGEKALLATALAVFAPEFMVLGSANAQPQILGILFSLLCFNSLLNMLESGKNEYRKHFILTIIFSALLVYSYTTYVIFVYLIFFIIVILKKKFSFIKDMAYLTIATIILSLPVLLKFIAFAPPNAGLGIAKKIVLDSYWYLIPIRIGLPAFILAFFSRLKKEHKKILYPFIIVMAFLSFFQLIAPFPPTRNLALLLFPLAILGADGWHYFVEKLRLKRHYKALTALLIIASIIAGIFAVYYFAKLETVTDEEYHALKWLEKDPGKTATFNFGPFNFRAEMQYNGADLFENLRGNIVRNRIDYVVLTTKTPELYGISNEKAAEKLKQYCSQVFKEKKVYIFDCRAYSGGLSVN